MRTLLFTLLFLFHSLTALAAEYKITEYDRHYSKDILTLMLTSEKGDNSNFDNIFKLIRFYEDSLSVRIGGLPLNTRKEIQYFYNKNVPQELDKALESSFNIHDPALGSLKKLFPQAFKTTELYKNPELSLNKYHYKVVDIKFEKLFVMEQLIEAATVTVYLEKNTQHQH